MNRADAKQAILKHDGVGWLGLVDKAFDFLEDKVEVTEVFEKWGMLKIRVQNTDFDADIHDFLSDIECESGSICPICGEEGTGYVLGGWVSTLCDTHYQERINKTAHKTI
jgi:hypothetical protein